LTSFADYLTRAKEEQKEIYYQIAPSREAIESGPYLEGFKARGLEVIYFFEPIDEYVCEAVREFSGKKLVAVDRAEVELDEVASDDKALDEAATESLCAWLKEIGGPQVESVRASKRLVGSPAAALTPEDGASAQLRAMMKAMNQDAPPNKIILEINPRHSLIHQLSTAKTTQPETAEKVARQLLDNALISAGLMEDPREMVQRMYELMGAALAK
jgi:molecular chaperone HtpG